MSDIAIPGFSSDSNSAKQIANLLKAKNIPLEKLEVKQEEYTTTKTIWQDLSITLSKLSDSSSLLYGFENPFNEKSVVSSNENILTADSERSAIDENLSFTVNKIASTDKFVSYQLDKDKTIPRGTYRFTIGEDDTVLKYRGGDLDDFVTKLNKKNPEDLKASIIKNSKSSQVLLIESLKTGKENSLIFKEDAISMGLDVGLIEKNSIENTQILVDDIISSKGSVSKTTKDLLLSPSSEISFRVNSTINESDIVEIIAELRPYSKDAIAPTPLDDLKVPNVTLSNITIESASGGGLERFLDDQDSDTAPVIDMNIITVSDDKYTLKLDPIVNNNNQKQTLTFTGDQLDKVNSINILNKNSDKSLLIHSVIVKKGAGKGDYIPVNPVTTADNAKISMNGMKIERDENEIDDLIDGTTLYLHNADPGEEVTLEIEHDIEYARDQILSFIGKYNESVQKILILTNEDSTIISEIEFADDTAKEKAEEIQGILKGDRTLNSVKQNLVRSITSFYPTDDENGFSLLKSIGISTNAGGSTGYNASKLRGYIEADVEELENALKNNIGAVKDLFGNDTNNDYIIDTGVAKAVDDLIKPYTRAGGTIASRISTIETQIKRTDKDISDYKDDLISYEETIRRKYGQMDATISTLNSSMQSIENLTNTGE